MKFAGLAICLILVAFTNWLTVANGSDVTTQPTSLPASAVDAKGLDAAIENLHAPMRQTAALSPQQELARFKLQPGFAIDLVASEPAIRQPLCINFDERGRMWVVQYIQYPFPAGMKVVEYDQYIRAKFDRISPPPPHQFPGRDRITILEDADGDGSFRKVKTFLDGLNIATSALPGRGGRGPGDYGVWVMNPPYLLFYPDRNRDDIPDADPIVHLSGFGLEDTHAVASNLTWGPDGWLYGTQGSTCTAKVRAELSDDAKTTNFLGQAIWRYQPETHRFEIFAEGGGNTFGLEFDDSGRAFSGTNWGKYRGLHYVQGGYYIKGWGKHGPLTNPYTFGFFDHMPHTGNAERLSHTFIVYGGGLLGNPYTGKIISPNSLQSRIQITRLESMGSSYKTVEEPFLATCDDGWFRPVDLKAGPDGAVYIADFYEKRISHVDPRDTWDRSTGRIFRIRPANWKPGLKPFDLGAASGVELVARLLSPNRWERNTARNILALRNDASAAAALQKLLADQAPQTSLEALWALHAVGALDEQAELAALGSRDGAVRTAAVQLAGDERYKAVSSLVLKKLLEIADREPDPQVRSQLASTAKRLPAAQTMQLVIRMLSHGEDAGDPHIPLLLWWAVEEKTASDREQVMAAFANSKIWVQPLARDVVLPRLARRCAADLNAENQKALTRLLESAPGPAEKRILLEQTKEGLGLTAFPELNADLKALLLASSDTEISLRLGDANAREIAVRVIQDESAPSPQRVRYIQLLAGAADSRLGKSFLKLIQISKATDVRKAAILSIGRYDDPSIGESLAAMCGALPANSDLRPDMIATLMGRSSWTLELLKKIDSGAILRSALGTVQIQRIRQYDDPAVIALADKLFGKRVNVTSAQHQQEISRITRIVTTGAGDASAGKALFTTRCAACHNLFGFGGRLGPDLTGYERRNVDFLVLSIVDPSAYIREEYTAFRVRTRGGETLMGLITDRSADRITLQDASQQKTVIATNQIVEERAMKTSIMPEGLLDGMSNQQTRDLFKYLSSNSGSAAGNQH